MMRFYVIAPRKDGGAGPKEIPEAEARERHAAGEEVLFSEDGGPLAPVPVAAPAEVPAEAPAAEAAPKRAKKG